MSEQYPGGFISKTEPTVNGSVARGMWTLSQAAGYRKQGLWPTVPAAPTIGTATGGDTTASVAFTAPSNIGSSAITSYTVTSSPGGFTGTGASSPVTVSGLTNGTAYTFTVRAANGAGTGPASAASNSVTPALSNYIEDVFSTYLYTGNGSTQTITNGINLSTNGGLVWVKNRGAVTDNALHDSTMPDSYYLSSNQTFQRQAGSTNSNIIAFTTSGFSVGITDNMNVNVSANNYVSWAFREQAKFFDVVNYTGNGTSSNTISHNLQSVPGCIIIKATSTAGDWWTFVENANSPGSSFILKLNTTAAAEGPAGGLNITSSSFNAADMSYQAAFNYTTLNASGVSYTAYVFANNAGGFGLTGSDNVITCGRFTTDGSGNASVTLGYEPQFMITKATSQAENWYINDVMRGFYAPSTGAVSGLSANTTAAEAGTRAQYVNSTGFTVVGGLSASQTYIYIAIRRGPMKIPTLGTSVFSPQTYTGTGAARTIDTSQTYLDSYIVNRIPGSGDNHNWLSRLTSSSALQTNNTAAAGSVGSITWASQDLSYTGSNYNTNESGTNYAAWTFKRAPSFMDAVCYSGTGVARTINHNLGVAPEMMLVCRRDGGIGFMVYSASYGTAGYSILNSTEPFNTTYWGSASIIWNNTTPTSTVFSLGTSGTVNLNGGVFIAYLFATCAGVSKVGSYTGTGALQTINCGFAAGARFILIKRTDSTGSWYVWDSANGISSGNDPYILLNTTGGQVTGTNYVDTDTTGFKVTAAAPADLNASGGTYTYLAIA